MTKKQHEWAFYAKPLEFRCTRLGCDAVRTANVVARHPGSLTDGECPYVAVKDDERSHREVARRSRVKWMKENPYDTDAPGLPDKLRKWADGSVPRRTELMHKLNDLIDYLTARRRPIKVKPIKAKVPLPLNDYGDDNAKAINDLRAVVLELKEREEGR